MARRMSNRKRIERMAEEAELAARERGAGGGESGRMRMVWVVKEAGGKSVKTFAYADEERAKSEAARLTREQNREHYVERAKVPM